MIRIILPIVFLLIATLLWAMCMAAATADEDAERMYQDYLEYKRRKEESEEEEYIHDEGKNDKGVADTEQL